MSRFQKHRARLFIIGLFLFAFLIFQAGIKQEHNQTWFDRIVLSLTAPIQHALIWTVDGSVHLWKKYVWLVGLYEDNLVLKSRLESSERDNARLKEVGLENERLRNLVSMRATLSERKVVAARVIGLGTTPLSRDIRIDVGRDDGVQTGDAVVAGAGLVGRVSAVTASYAEIQLLVDSHSAVDVVVQRSRSRGIVRGRGESGLCSVDHLVRTADVTAGDTVVTSGLGGAYPAGLQVGTISSVTSPEVGVFREALLQPFVAFEYLEEVLVVLGSADSTAPQVRAQGEPGAGHP
jgi:rod shape-determining protein MreC